MRPRPPLLAYHVNARYGYGCDIDANRGEGAITSVTTATKSRMRKPSEPDLLADRSIMDVFRLMSP